MYSNPQLAIRVLTELQEEINKQSKKRLKKKKKLHKRNTNNTITL
jgi:hypothetical protein